MARRALALGLLAAAPFAPYGFAAKEDLTLVSVASDGTAATGGGAETLYGGGSVSADGRYVAFHSGASNLSSEDADPTTDIFVRDTLTGTTVFVSRATDGTAGTANSTEAAISPNGRYVAFGSDADELSDIDDNSVRNLFVRDLQEDTTILVSRADGVNGAVATGENSESPGFSADSRFVVFTSKADNLSTEDNNDFSQIFMRDLQTGSLTLISRQEGTGVASQGANGHSGNWSGGPSTGGRYVVFNSLADNLATGDTNGVRDVFVRDTVENTTTLVSRATGSPGDIGSGGESESESISADGRYVAFESKASNLVPDDGNGEYDVFVRDTVENTTTLVSRPTGTGGPVGTLGNSDWSFAPQISADGRFVSFWSNNDQLSSEDNDANEDIFVRDLQQNTLFFISRAQGAAGTGGDGNSSQPGISANGEYVAFGSDADNLSGADDNSVTNIFLRHFRDPPENTAAPAITGTAQEGQTVSCGAGTWGGTSVVLTYQWTRDGGPISGATGGSYVLTAEDVGKSIACTVTGTNADGTASAASAGVLPTSAPAPDPGGGTPDPGGGTPDPGGGDPVPDTTDPTLSAFSLSSSAFKAATSGGSIAAKSGTRVSYELSEAATVTFSVRRIKTGRKRAGKCEKPAKRNRGGKKCKRLVLLGSFEDVGEEGRNRIRFTGRLDGEPLRRGNYKLTVQAVDAAGNESRTRTRPFRIIR